MSYNYSKGAQIMGDISGSDDAQRNTGIDFEDDYIGLVTSGSTVLAVSGSKVGIGTSNPSTTFHAYADASSAYVATIDNDAGTSAHGLKVTTDGTGTGTNILALEAASTTVFKVRGDGRVGIGVDTPGSTLSVDDEIAVGEKLIHRGDPNTYLQFPSNDNITFAAGGSEELKIASDAILVKQYIKHDGDEDTLINFADDKIVLKAGNIALVTAEKKGSAPHEVTINDGGNNVDFVVKGNGSNQGNPGMKFDASTNKLGINGIGTPAYELEVDGNIGLSEYIYHRGDDDTFIRFEADNITLKAGNVNFIELTEDDSQDKLICNNGSADLDFIVRSPNESLALYLNAGNEVFHINHGESNFKTKIHSDHGEAITVNDTGVIFNDDGHATNDFRIESDTNTHMFFVDSGNNKVGIGTTSPKTGLDVHHDPTGLGNDTGGGEVVKFGSGTLTAGKLYYLSGSTWTETDADGVVNGADQLLGIALGSSPTSNGVLLRGFFDAHSYLSNFSAGKAVYVSTTAAGMDTTAPTGGGDYVRIVGYCTTTANVIYFNPSTTWVEL